VGELEREGTALALGGGEEEEGGSGTRHPGKGMRNEGSRNVGKEGRRWPSEEADVLVCRRDMSFPIMMVPLG
jgi:hypothetical protein